MEWTSSFSDNGNCARDFPEEEDVELSDNSNYSHGSKERNDCGKRNSSSECSKIGSEDLSQPDKGGVLPTTRPQSNLLFRLTLELKNTMGRIKVEECNRGVIINKNNESQIPKHSNVVIPVSVNANRDKLLTVDKEANFIIRPGEIIKNRYTLRCVIGKGAFGQVAHATDNFTGQDVAIKIIKNLKPLYRQAQIERQILSFVSSDAEKNHIVQLYDDFVFKGHQCFVCEKLSLSLYDVLKKVEFRGLALSHIQHMARQIIRALRYLSHPKVDVIHCDLKPENIMLHRPDQINIKIIDFGSSCKASKCRFSYIQSRSYRAPEAIMSLPLSKAIDMWSVGCILVELHVGEPLFQSQDTSEQMGKFEQLLGRVPQHMINRCSEETRSQFFVPKRNQAGGTTWHLKTNSATQNDCNVAEYSDTRSILTEKVMLHCYKNSRFASMNEAQRQAMFHNYGLFVDFISRILVYDPEKRLTPDHATRHPFLSCKKPNI